MIVHKVSQNKEKNTFYFFKTEAGSDSVLCVFLDSDLNRLLKIQTT